MTTPASKHRVVFDLILDTNISKFAKNSFSTMTYEEVIKNHSNCYNFLIFGCDANAHHVILGSKKSISVYEYLASTHL